MSYLKNSEVGLPGKSHLFPIAGVSVVAMIVEPLLQDLDRLLGQVASPLPGNLGPGSAVLLRG